MWINVFKIKTNWIFVVVYGIYRLVITFKELRNHIICFVHHNTFLQITCNLCKVHFLTDFFSRHIYFDLYNMYKIYLEYEK